MDAKIITGFLLSFCLIASLSISQTASATLDSRQRIRRQNDESISCAEGTKPCKDDNNTCATYCNGKPECADGSDEIDCATNASTTSLPSEVNPVAQSTESSANEIERAVVPQGTTDISEVTLQQITILDRETVPAAAIDTTANVAEKAVTKAAEAATAILADGTTLVLPRGTTAVIAAEATTAAAETATAVLADGTTIVLPPGTTAVIAAEVTTAAAETATAVLADGTTIVLPRGTTAVIAAEATTAAAETATAILADGTTIVLPPGTTAVIADDTTTAAAETATAVLADGTTIVLPPGTTAVIADDVTNGTTDEKAISAGANLETSTIIIVDTATNGETSVKPRNGHEAEVGNDTTSFIEGTTSADGITNQTATVDAITIDSNVTAIVSNDTATDDITKAPMIDTATGNDTLLVTTIDTPEADEYEDESEENIPIQTTDTTITPINDDDDIDEEEDDAINDQDVITTTTTQTTAQPITSRTTKTTVNDDVEYYDEPDDDNNAIEDIITTTTIKTTRTTRRVTIATATSINGDVEYYDDPDEDGVIENITTTTTSKTTITTATSQKTSGAKTTIADDVEYYDVDEDETAKVYEIPTVKPVPDEKRNETKSNTTEEATTPSSAQPGPSARVDLRVVVSPEILQVQRGQTYDLTCSVYGADASTNIYWIQEEPERRYALVDPSDANDKQITMSQVSLRARITLDDPSKIGKYTCMAQDAAGNSGSAILTMQEGRAYYPPSGYPPRPSGAGGYLRIVAPDMAEGDYVEIQCEGASQDDEGRIQWFFNNRSIEGMLLSDEQPLYPRGKTLHIRPISRPYLGAYRCSIPGSSYADATSVLTFGGPVAIPPGGPSYGAGFTVTVEIAQGQTAQGQAQIGSQVILRCRTNEQASNYRWTFTGQGTVDRGYSDQLVLPRATAQDSGLYTCEATSTRGQTARGSTNLYISSTPSQPVSGRCSIDEATCRNGRCIPRAYLYDGKNDCGDNSDEGAGPVGDLCQPNEIRCTHPDRGRKCVQKFWMCDGDRDCDDGSDEDQRYCDLLPRQRHCKPSEFHCGGPNATTPNPVCIPRSFQCDGYNDCPDRSDEVGCVKPSVVAAPQRQIQINVGQTLTIQCTARGSPAPYINWRLNWGHVCGDGSDNGRCIMAQSIDTSDPSLVTGTLTVRNVHTADGGAYSCEALNNQGFIFAIPDAIVDIVGGAREPQQQQQQPCNCHGHSSYCSPDGRCQNCQHNTAGYGCEFCAPGYQGDARRGTPDDCQPLPVGPPSSNLNCNPSGTHMESGNRCICKYNVEGERCDQCKRSHFYLNPTTPNGCLPCFCSGVSTDCGSTDWRRQAVPLPLNNWNAVPKEFATDRYEAGDRIKKLHGGREISLDQSSLPRPASDVLYWKAPKETLGDLVTLYDGNIDIHFTNDGNDKEAPSNDEFIWLRGNNIDLVHKLPQSQKFKANTNATYSVPCNERTFTRKDGTHIDRDNILMALSDLDTLLVKINPIGGRKSAILRGVTLNIATREGYSDTAPTVESCRCPANYTGASCEKCAEGYGRPHPLIGIYLGQCWSCRSICHDRSDRCDRETGKCLDCQGNSEGDRCERCHSGYILDGRLNQCVPQDQYRPYPSQPSGPDRSGGYYIDHQPYDVRGTTPLNIVLDGSQREQRIPLQVLNAQPQSVVWGRTDGSPLPANVAQEGNDLVFRNPSAEQAGNYISTVTHPDGSVDRIFVYLEFRPGQGGYGPSYGQASFSPASPLTISEGASQLIQPQGAYYRVQWRRDGNQPLPSGIYQSGNSLQISNARPDQSGTYYVELYGADGTPITVPYEIRVQSGHRPAPSAGGPPRISIEPKVINLREGQRMIVQYSVSSHDPIEVIWNKLTDQGYTPIPSLFTVETNRLVLNRATMEAAGIYQVVVRNPQGEDRQELQIIVEPRRGRGRGGQQTAGAPQISFQQNQYSIGSGEVIDIVPNISGGSGATTTWLKDGSTSLPDGVVARNDGALRVEGRSSDVGGRYTLDVANAYGQVSSSLYIIWSGSSGHHGGHDSSRSHINVRLESRDEQSHQIGRDIHLYCSVHGGVEQPYEYTFTKDGRSLENNVEVNPNGLLIIRNAQANSAGRYRCEVNFPRAPEAGVQESTYDLRLDDSSSFGGYQYGNEYQPQGSVVEVTVEPSDATIGRGETVNLTCNVKGAQQYTLTWGKYAHDTSLPKYARQQGYSVILAPTDDSPSEQMYLQCSVAVPGQPQPYVAYAPVTIRANDELRKKKKKRRS